MNKCQVCGEDTPNLNGCSDNCRYIIIGRRHDTRQQIERKERKPKYLGGLTQAQYNKRIMHRALHGNTDIKP